MNKEDKPLTDWQLIFAQSKANDGLYLGDLLPHAPRAWPRGWLTRRLEELKAKEQDFSS